VGLSAENRKSIVSGPKPSASLIPACQAPQATVPDADVHSAASFFSYLYIVSQYTVRLMTPCVWRILCLRNSSSAPYFRQPPNLPTAAWRNQKCTECGTTAFGQNRMSTESAHLSTFVAETETEIQSTFKAGYFCYGLQKTFTILPLTVSRRNMLRPFAGTVNIRMWPSCVPGSNTVKNIVPLMVIK